MIEYKFLGLLRKSGTFKDSKSGDEVPFDNAFLHFAVSGLPNTYGSTSTFFKVKGRDAQDVLGMSLNDFVSLADSLSGHTAQLVFVPGTDGDVALGAVDIE